MWLGLHWVPAHLSPTWDPASMQLPRRREGIEGGSLERERSLPQMTLKDRAGAPVLGRE